VVAVVAVVAGAAQAVEVLVDHGDDTPNNLLLMSGIEETFRRCPHKQPNAVLQPPSREGRST
jgi:hypothetical protein